MTQPLEREAEFTARHWQAAVVNQFQARSARQQGGQRSSHLTSPNRSGRPLDTEVSYSIQSHTVAISQGTEMLSLPPPGKPRGRRVAEHQAGWKRRQGRHGRRHISSKHAVGIDRDAAVLGQAPDQATGQQKHESHLVMLLTCWYISSEALTTLELAS